MKRQKIRQTRAAYYRHQLRNLLVSVMVLGLCLLAGILGYHYTDGIAWIDSLHNASMILSGMGPVVEIKSESGKIFSSLYALFSGVVFITNIGIILTPIIHHIVHRFHLDDEE